MKHLLLLIPTLWLSAAHAASFDCAKAQSRVEKAICADPALGRLDEAIGQEYKTLAGRIEPRFQAKLLEAQKVWLKNRDRSDNLREAMGKRLDELKTALVTTNAVTLLRIDGRRLPPYVLTPLPGAAAYNREVDGTWDTARHDLDDIPGMRECDRLAEADEASLKPAQRKKIAACDDHMVMYRGYDVDFVSPDLISVQEDLTESHWREAHPSNSTGHLNRWLSKAGAVKPEDIFASNGYRAPIRRAVQRYLADAGIGAEEQSPDRDYGADEPDNWGVTVDGLRITGQGYDYGIGRGFVEIAVPWRDFGPAVRPQFLQLVKKYPASRAQ